MDKENKKKEMEEETESIQESEDVVFEEDPRDLIKKLKEKLKTAQEERQAYLEGWQRDKADFINARKDDEKRNVELLKFAKEGLIEEIIPVLDSFELAVKNPSWGSVSPEWQAGVEHIYSQLKNVLSTNGIAEVDPLGEKFNPREHHAMGIIAVSDEEEDGKILEVVQKGYTLNGKIVRTANVKIGEFKKGQ
ncbi:MAG: nucleotide exchange factor GrpE [Patescibacteria group bacterium]|nr:nucleotide exchange factor GrpE [bacterium]MDZ4240560.1 nucleotide exchange factor GrpE [Patescibacteria group bacterium]